MKNIISLKNITKTYSINSAEQLVLDDISYDFEENQCVFFLGESGCGKSTALNIIAGLDSKYNGKVLYANEAISDYDEFRREHVSFIFQDSNLISHHNILKNIIIGLNNSVENKEELALALLEKVGLAEHAYKKPEQLSTGERQRASIARALARDTDILLCDEPTASLDEKTKFEICELIFDVFKDKTIIFVSHDEELAKRYADETVVIENSKFHLQDNKKAEESQQSSSSENSNRKKASSFKNRFYTNMLSEKLKLFNSLLLFILIAGVFMFALGSFKAVKRGIDDYMCTKHNVDRILVASAGNGMSLPALKVNIEDYNKLYKDKIRGLSLACETSLYVGDKSFPAFINMMQKEFRAKYEKDIVYGRFPEKPREILFSKGYAIYLIYLQKAIESNNDKAELKKIFYELQNISNEELYSRLKAMPILYKRLKRFFSWPPKPENYFEVDFEIVGIIDDLKYSDTYSPELLFKFRNLKNITDMYSLIVQYHDWDMTINYPIRSGESDFSDEILVNENIYILEDGFVDYMTQWQYGDSGYKFQFFKLIIDGDLNARRRIHDNYLLFKFMFKGQDDISQEREGYLADIYGYKLSIIFSLAILAVFAVISAYHGLKNLILSKRSDIAIYRSLGYKSNELKSMFIKEALIISLFASLFSFIIFVFLSYFLGNYFIKLLDPSRIINLHTWLNFDIYSLLISALAIILLIVISIRVELKKNNIDELIR